MTGLVTDPIAWWARAQPDVPAISFGGDAVAYRELDAWTAAMGADLAARGVEVGDRVAIAGANCLEWCIAAVGALRAGAILVPLNIRLVADELAYLVAETTPRIVLADAGRRDLMKDVASRGVEFELADLETVAEFRTAPPQPFRCEADAQGSAVIVFTSGTTARPKGVIFSHQSTLNFIFEWSLVEPDFTRGMRLLLVLPLGGAPGTLWGLIHVLVHGGTLFLETHFDPPVTLRALNDHQITCFLGVPSSTSSWRRSPSSRRPSSRTSRPRTSGGPGSRCRCCGAGRSAASCCARSTDSPRAGDRSPSTIGTRL